MSSQNPISQYQATANGGGEELVPARNKPPGQPLPKPLPQQLQMSRLHQPNLLPQQYYNQGKIYDKYAGTDAMQVPVQGLPGGGGVNVGAGNVGVGNVAPGTMGTVGANASNPAANMVMMRGLPQAYNQMPMHAYTLGPGEMINNNYATFQMPAEQWDQFGTGMRQLPGNAASGPGGPGMTMGGVGGGVSQLGSNVVDKKPRARAHGSRGSLSSDSQDEIAAKDGDFDGDVPQSAGGLAKVAKRSRMGCLTCRQRKKRCCETRPKCTECLRLRLTCTWPKPGTEHKNKPKEVKSEENTIEHDVYGKIKVLRGIVEYRSDQ